MSATLAALVRETPTVRAGAWRSPSLLGALTVVFGVGLMATAGYLISRAAERPAILSLTVAIVAVRFFGLGAADRALPRAARLPRPRAARARRGPRAAFYERIEPLAPAQLDGYRARRPALADGG